MATLGFAEAAANGSEKAKALAIKAAQFLVAEQCHEGQGHLFCAATPLTNLLDKILPGGKAAPASVTRAATR